MVNAWATHWTRAADHCLTRADGELEADRFNPAGHAYLTAAEYYWLALCEPTLTLGERRALEEAHVSAFRTAVPLLPYAGSPFTLEHDGAEVHGYLFLPAGTPSCAVAWNVPAGGTVESTYWQVAVPVLESGAACVVYTAADSDGTRQAVARWLREATGIDHLIEPDSAAARPWETS